MSLTTHFISGKKAARYALDFWDCLPEKAARQIIWNAPMRMRREILARDCMNAVTVCAVCIGSDPFGLGWAQPYIAGGGALNAHFCFVEPLHSLCLSAALPFMDRMEEKTLVGQIPAPFTGAIRFACSLGFERLGIIPNAAAVWPSRRQRALVVLRKLPKQPRKSLPMISYEQDTVH